MKNLLQFSFICGNFRFLTSEITLQIANSPIGEQLLSSRTNVTKIKEIHKKRMVRAAGEENSSSPVALPRAFLVKLGRKVADAVDK